jgi:hypothetical protein
LGYCKVDDHWELASKGVTDGTDEDGEQFSKVLKGDPARSFTAIPSECPRDCHATRSTLAQRQSSAKPNHCSNLSMKPRRRQRNSELTLTGAAFTDCPFLPTC